MRAHTRADIALRYSQNLYIAAYLLFIFKHLFDTSSIIQWPAFVDNLFNTLFMVLLFIKLTLQRYTVLQFLGLSVVFVLCFYSSVNAHYFSPSLSLMLILSLQNVNLQSVLRVGYRCKAAVISLHVVCYFILIFASPDSIVLIYREGIVRHFFLLGHPNMFAALVVWACLEYIYVNYERLRATHMACIFLINIAVYHFTDSRTGMYVFITVSVFLILEKYAARLARAVIHPIAKYGFGVCSVLCVVITTAYTPSLSGKARDTWIMINNLLTGRLTFGAYAYYNFGFTWLGRTLHIPDKVYYNGHWMDGVIFDNSYQWLLIVYGSVFLIIISWAFFSTVSRMSTIEKILVFSYILYALMENYIVNIAICFPLLLIGKYMYVQRRQSVGSFIVSKEDPVPLWKRKSV